MLKSAPPPISLEDRGLTNSIAKYGYDFSFEEQSMKRQLLILFTLMAMLICAAGG